MNKAFSSVGKKLFQQPKLVLLALIVVLVVLSSLTVAKATVVTKYVGEIEIHSFNVMVQDSFEYDTKAEAEAWLQNELDLAQQAYYGNNANCPIDAISYELPVTLTERGGYEDFGYYAWACNWGVYGKVTYIDYQTINRKPKVK